jgi:hypothetical protein
MYIYMSFNIKNNNVNFVCAPMYNSNNNQIMGYMCSSSKNIEPFTSKISNTVNVCKGEDTLYKNVCAKKCPTGYTDTSGTLICSENRRISRKTYEPLKSSKNKCRRGHSLDPSTNMCVASCPRGFADISDGQCARTFYARKKTYRPVSESEYGITGSEISEIKSETPISNPVNNCRSGYTLSKNSCVQNCPTGFTDNNATLTCSEKTTIVKNMYPPSDSSQNTCKSGDFFNKSTNKCTTRCPRGFIDTNDGMCTKTLSIRKKYYRPTSESLESSDAPES